MVQTPKSCWLWPGLPQVWRHGSWSGLAVAVAFAAVLNFLFIATFGWSEWIAPGARNLGWLVLAAAWSAAIVVSVRNVRHARGSEEGETTEDLFRLAQGEYLKGAWYEAELALNRLLRRDGHDLEARLMLATLFRHTGRIPEAGDQLRRLERCDGSEVWQLEIEGEWALLKEMAQATESKTATVSDEEPPEIAAAA